MSDDSATNKTAGPVVNTAPPPPHQPAASTGLDAGADPVLHHLKELQEANTQKDAIIEKLQKESRAKDERVKELSADKRKEMESFMQNVVDTWLGSLGGVSEDNNNNFRNGIKTMAEAADMRNPAWEIVCNASLDHQSNVKKIEELLQINDQKDKMIEELKGFKSEAARIGSSTNFSINKRQRLNEENPNTEIARHLDSHMSSTITAAPAGDGNCWDNFTNMLRQDSRCNYY